MALTITLKQAALSLNIPNILTVIRILLTPLFVIFLIKNLYSCALLTFTVAGISDGLDGLLARYFNQRTVLGAYLDPIADKLLLTSAFVSLAILKVIPGWLTVIVISRDILITIGIVIFSIVNIDFVVKPSIASKCTTVSQLATVFLTLLSLSIPITIFIKFPLYWLTAALTIISGLHYIYIGLNILQNASLNNKASK